MKVGIVSLFLKNTTSLFCRTIVWCANMQRLNSKLFGGNGSVVIIGNVANVCPFPYTAIPLDQSLINLAKRFVSFHKTNRRMSTTTSFQFTMLVKLQMLALTQFDRIIYTDTDVDPYFLISNHKVAQLNKARAHLYSLESNVLLAESDHESPINCGILVLTPNLQTYNIALDILQKNRFNITHGFEFAGPPSTFLSNVPSTRGSRCVVKNTWEFVCSDADQGMFTHLAYVRKLFHVRKMRFLPSVHFWGPIKPFKNPGCQHYTSHIQKIIPKHECLKRILPSSSKRCWISHYTNLVR